MNSDFHKKPEMIRFFFLLAQMGVCFLLTIIRWLITKKTLFIFLNWNLFLAAIPWLISLVITSGFIKEKPKIISFVLFVFWFLFFPNTAYIVTDLYYLKNHSEKMFWYDLIMILLFSWTGLLLGFFSLERIEKMLRQKVKKVKSVIIICGFLFVCAFGVYLGRDLKWNSWDVFLEPKEFFLDVLDRFIRPLGHGRTWSFTFLMGIFLNAIYWPLKMIQQKN
jgi:uncharacterized membrane protein